MEKVQFVLDKRNLIDPTQPGKLAELNGIKTMRDVREFEQNETVKSCLSLYLVPNLKAYKEIEFAREMYQILVRAEATVEQANSIVRRLQRKIRLEAQKAELPPED